MTTKEFIDVVSFWRWPKLVRKLSKELTELEAKHEALKVEHEKVVSGQVKLIEWIKVTHRLHRAPEGIRLLIQQGRRIVPLLFLLVCQSLFAQPFPPILRQPLTTNSHFGPTPTEGQVPTWNAAAKKWSNNVPAGGASTPHTWTNDNGTLKPIAFPTNILLRVNVPDDGIGTNFYFDSRVNRTNAHSKLFTIRNGGSNALTIGPDGGLFAGRGNNGPFPGGVLYGLYDTALGETNQQEIFTLSGNSAVGYSGAADLIIDTNYGALILFANKEGGVKFTRFSVQAGAGDNPQDFNTFTMQALVDGATYMQMDPNFSLLTPTNYLFSSSIRITNTHTLLSLQNSNFPVLEVDGVGDLRLIKKIPYLWPSSQGAAGTALTNNGSGALGWWPVSASAGPPGLTTNANQFLGAPLSIKDGAFLTNVNVQSSLEVSNGWIYASGPVTNGTQLNLPHLTVSRSAIINAQGDVTNSSADSNWSLYTTNVWNSRQGGSLTLTNLAGTGAITNLFTPSLSNISIKPLVVGIGDAAGATNTTGQIRGLEAGGNILLSENGSNVVISASVSGSGISTNENQFGPSVPVTIKDGALLTNLIVETSLKVSNGFFYAEGPVTNGTELNLPHLTISRSAIINAQGDLTNSSADSNWSLYPTNVWNDRQFGSQNLTNWSNIPTGSMANVVSTTFLTNWANAISNLAETKQLGSAVLTNLVSTVARNVTNFVSLSTTNATSKPLTNSYTAGVLTMFGIEQGSGQAITMNASNIVMAIDWAQTASTTNVVGVSNWVNSVSNLVQTKQNGSAVLTNLVGTVANNVTNVVSLSTTNATSKPLTNAYANGVLTLFGVEQGSGLALTMSSNIVVANDWAQTASTTNVVGVSNWVNSVSNLANTKQFGSLTLTNLSGTGAITNLFTLSLSNATIKPLVVGVGTAAGATNTTGEIRGLEAGANITLTPNGSNYVIASTAGGTVTFSDLVWTNDGATIYPLVHPNRIQFTTNTIAGVVITVNQTNTILGFDALKLNVSGGQNVAVGTRSMQKLQSGIDNVAVGYETLTNNISGNDNTVIGSQAALFTQGDNNTAGGNVALRQNVSGSRNSAWGKSALRLALGDDNSGFGQAAGSGLTAGKQNLYLGSEAGSSAHTATNTTFIGFNADGGATITDGGQMVFGSGVSNYAFRLINYIFPPAQGAAGTILSDDGAGNLSWSGAFQPGSTILTNLSGTGAITNLFSATLSNATIKPLVVGVGNAAGATNTTGDIRGLEAGANITLTPNGSNYVIAAAVTGGSVSFSDLVWTNDQAGNMYPVAFPTNVIFNPTNAGSVGQVEYRTNFLFGTSTRRIGGTNTLLAVKNGPATAFIVGDQGIMIGSTNYIPVASMAIDIAYDTAFGVDSPLKTITMTSYSSDVGYSGTTELGVNTNKAVMSLNANKEGNGFIQLTEQVGGIGGASNYLHYAKDVTVVNGNNTIIIPYRIDPDFFVSPTGYIFGSTFRITNTHMLMSLQNSNFPVFAVDGVGDIRTLKKIAYTWPSSQGAAQSVLTNDGSGNLGWGVLASGDGSLTTNASQFGASVQLTLRDGVTVTNENNIGILNITNAPGSDRALRIWQTNGQAYVDFAAPTNQWLPTNRFIFSVTNPVAGQVLKLLSVDIASGVASITITNGTDNSDAGLLTNANQFAANTTLTIKESAVFTNVFLYPSNVTGPASIAYAGSGQATNLEEWRQTNGAVGLGISSNGLYELAIPLLHSNAIAFRTNNIDFKLAQWQTFSNALKTNLVLQLTNCNDGVIHTLEAFGAGRLGNGLTNAWQLLCTVAAGNTIYWPPGSTNGNYDVLVNSNQVVTFTFRQVFNTNIFASYLVREAGGAN